MKTEHGDLTDPHEERETVRKWAHQTRAPVTDRVNSEPPIFNGMTQSEGKWIAVFSLVTYGFIGGFIFLLTGWWQALIAIVIFGTIVTMWYGSLYLAKIKRNRPDGYYIQAIHLWLADRGMAGRLFLRHSNFWSVGRTMPFGGFESPLVVRERSERRLKSVSAGARSFLHF